MMEQTLIKIKITTIVRETEKSYLLNCEGDQDWFPKSMVHVYKDQMQLEVPTWLLDKKGWTYG